MRKPKRVKIRGPLRPGIRVPRQAPPGNGVWPKQFRYYNPDGGPFEMELDLDAWLQLLIRDGEIEIVPDVPAEKPKPAARRADKE